MAGAADRRLGLCSGRIAATRRADEELQEQLEGLKGVGVELYACKGCADLYGVSDKLSSLDIEVMYTGTMLAELQQKGWHVLTI